MNEPLIENLKEIAAARELAVSVWIVVHKLYEARERCIKQGSPTGAQSIQMDLIDPLHKGLTPFLPFLRDRFPDSFK